MNGVGTKFTPPFAPGPTNSNIVDLEDMGRGRPGRDLRRYRMVSVVRARRARRSAAPRTLLTMTRVRMVWVEQDPEVVSEVEGDEDEEDDLGEASGSIVVGSGSVVGARSGDEGGWD